MCISRFVTKVSNVLLPLDLDEDAADLLNENNEAAVAAEEHAL